jgi:hypothetical protein
MAEKQHSFLTFLPQASTKQLCFLLKNITTDQLNAIGEVCYNVLFGSVDTLPLKKYTRIIRELGDKHLPRSQRKALVCKHPQFIVQLIKTVLP